MSSLSESATRTEKVLHRILHEIEERLDINADNVAEIVEMWEDLKEKYGIPPRQSPNKTKKGERICPYVKAEARKFSVLI